jgi:GxxExxY protein
MIEDQELNQLSEAVIAAAFEVGNQLGAGFLEKVYERALGHELKLRGLPAQTQGPLRLKYKGQPVGDYFADMIVAQRLLVEVKCVDAFSDEHLAQCLNYLKATGLRLALLINFQKSRVAVKRVIRD